MGDEELKLEPLDETTKLRRKQIREVPLPPVGDRKKPSPEAGFQVSILQMMIATLVVGTATALCQWVSPNLIAGLAGLFTFGILIGISLSGTRRPILQLVCLLFGLIYVVVAVAVVINS